MSGSEDFKLRRGETRSYRSGVAGAHSSSDDSTDGEEDTPLWRQKQEKYFRKQKGNGGVAMCSSPTLPEVRTDSATVQASQKKKSNNIWGSVLTEQDLTQTMVRSAAVDKPEELSYNERNVESYDFTKKYEDNRRSWDEPVSPEDKNETLGSSLAQSVSSGPAPGRSIIDYEDTLRSPRDTRDRSRNLNRQNRKRKADHSDEREQRSNIHERLGVKKVTTTRLGDIDMTVDMEISELTTKISDFLHEPKVEIIERILTHLGKDFAIRLVQATREVEESGGMYTLDGTRRRTPGGVYLTLLKQQPEWNKDARKLVFVEDVEEQVRHRKEKRKKAKQHRKRKNKAEKQSDEQGTNKSRSRSNSISRSRSNSNSSTKSTPHKKEDALEAMEDVETKTESKSRNTSGSYSNRQSRKYESSEDSGDEYETSQKSNWSKPFNFEDELAAAKKLILEKSVTKNNTETEVMESDNIESQDKENGSDMTDLETAEANVVDIEIGIDDTV